MYPFPMHTPSHWEAEIALGFTRLDSGTVLSERRHRGPLRVQKALYPEGRDVCQTILLHPPSGIAGGDRLHIAVNVGPQAHAQITTPGAGKWYRSGGEDAAQTLAFTVGADAILEWLPQETIVFDGAQARMETQVSLAADAINAFVDWLGFDPRFKNQSQRTILFGGKSVSLFDPPPVISGEPHIAEQETPYDRFWYTDWLRAMAYSVMANVDFDGQQSLNPEQNNRLREILQAFKG